MAYGTIRTRNSEDNTVAIFENQKAALRLSAVALTSGEISLPSLVSRLDAMKRQGAELETLWPALSPTVDENTRAATVSSALTTLRTACVDFFWPLTVQQVATRPTAPDIVWTSIAVPGAIVTPASALITAIDAL